MNPTTSRNLRTGPASRPASGRAQALLRCLPFLFFLLCLLATVGFGVR